jgi:hypothetical protein
MRAIWRKKDKYLCNKKIMEERDMRIEQKIKNNKTYENCNLLENDVRTIFQAIAAWMAEEPSNTKKEEKEYQFIQKMIERLLQKTDNQTRHYEDNHLMFIWQGLTMANYRKLQTILAAKGAMLNLEETESYDHSEHVDRAAIFEEVFDSDPTPIYEASFEPQIYGDVSANIDNKIAIIEGELKTAYTDSAKHQILDSFSTLCSCLNPNDKIAFIAANMPTLEKIVGGQS